MRYVIKNPDTGYYAGNILFKKNLHDARLWHRRAYAEQSIINRGGGKHGWVVVSVNLTEAA